MGETQDAIIPDVAPAILESFSFTKGFICNSTDKLDQHIVEDLRQRSLPFSNLPVRFVAPLISKKSDDQQKVNQKI